MATRFFQFNSLLSVSVVSFYYLMTDPEINFEKMNKNIYWGVTCVAIATYPL